MNFDLSSRNGQATALIAAVEASNERAVDILIATGADLAIEARDMLHWNALDHAVIAGDIALTERLLLASDRWDLNERGDTTTFTGLSSTFERVLASKNKALIETVLRLGRKIDFTQKHPWTGRPILELIDDEAILELVMQYANEAE